MRTNRPQRIGRRPWDMAPPVSATTTARLASWFLALAATLVLAASAGANDPIRVVKAARLPPDTGRTVETALSGYAYFKDPVWETYVDGERRTLVRFVAEYDVARGLSDCPAVGPEVRPAARVFVTLLYVLRGDGVVSLADAFIDAYSATGYSAKYQAEPWITDRIYAGQACVGCMPLYLPSAL